MADSEELAQLRREYELSSLGDRPHAMAAAKLKRLAELEREEQRTRRPIRAWVEVQQ